MENSSHKKLGFFGMLKETASRWSQDHGQRLAAALAYYTAFSIAPLLVIVIAIAGFVFGQRAAQGQIVNQLSGMVGQNSAATLQSMIRAANKPGQGLIATILGVIGLLGGATGVLSELKDGLNKIWRAAEPSGFMAVFRRETKLLSMILVIGFLLLISLVVNAGVAVIGQYFTQVVPIPEWLMHIIYGVIAWGIIAVLFGFMYRVLPNATIAWRDVWVGAFVTAFLFEVGQFAMGLYLGKTGTASSYGAAGSVLVLLLWVYYSGIIFYFGAEFTKVFADNRGSLSRA